MPTVRTTTAENDWDQSLQSLESIAVRDARVQNMMVWRRASFRADCCAFP